MLCDFCGCKNVFYKRICEGVSLCKRCFKKNIEEKVRRTISKYSMLSHDDHVAVAVSGGKDSLTLLSILSEFTSRFPNSKLTAVTIDEGISGYRDEAIKLAEEHCKKLGVKQVIFSFEEFFGVTLDELIRKRKGVLSECSYCGILRRRALDKAGKMANADKIATAHNLDDEIQTFMLNIFHGGIERIARADSSDNANRKSFVRKIKPMCELYEKEIALYAYLSRIEFQSMPCPYSNSSLRNDMRSMLNSIEENHPGVKYTVYRTKEKLTKAMNEYIENFELNTCKICSAPTSTNICEVCKLLRNVSHLKRESVLMSRRARELHLPKSLD